MSSVDGRSNFTPRAQMRESPVLTAKLPVNAAAPRRSPHFKGHSPGEWGKEAIIFLLPLLLLLLALLIPVALLDRPLSFPRLEVRFARKTFWFHCSPLNVSTAGHPISWSGCFAFLGSYPECFPDSSHWLPGFVVSFSVFVSVPWVEVLPPG